MPRFSESRSRLRAGHAWLGVGRIRTSKLSYPTSSFEILKVEGSLLVEVDTKIDVQLYPEHRRSALSHEVATVATFAENGHLPYIDLADGELEITPLRCHTARARSLSALILICFDVVEITDVLYSIG